MKTTLVPFLMLHKMSLKSMLSMHLLRKLYEVLTILSAGQCSEHKDEDNSVPTSWGLQSILNNKHLEFKSHVF